MTKDYKVTSKLIAGAIYLRYEKGELTNIVFELTAPMNEQIFNSFRQRVQQQENLKSLSEGFEVKQLTNGRSVQDKIVMFSSAYKYYRGVPYKAKELEKANIKNVPVTRELLDTFFNSPLANYTLDNYIKRINVTRDWAHNGMNNHLLSTMPNDYDPTFESTLKNEQLSEYWERLRANGWRKTDRGWVKE